MPGPTVNLIAALLLGVTTLAGCQQGERLVEQRLLEFGTVIDIALIHPDQRKAEQALQAMELQLAGYRANWHAWEASDLTRFNTALASMQTIEIPASLRELVKLSQYYYQTSQHLFNPAIGKLISAYGFQGAAPDLELIAQLQQDIPTMLDLEISDDRIRNSNSQLQLDFGGIAKGYALAQLGTYLQQQGFEHYLLNAGGDLQVLGSKFGKPWRIAVQNPFAPGAIASIELLGEQNLFTSGNYQRAYKVDGKILHHIIDPRDGAPSSLLSSVTVLSPDPVLADVAATSLMIDGWNNHRSLAASLGITDYMIVGEDRHILITRSLARQLTLLVDWPVTFIDQDGG